MRGSKTIVAAAVAALALAAALCVPTLAMAQTMDPSATPLASTTATPAPAAHPGKKLIKKYRVLANAKLKAFNLDANVLRRHINRLEVITTLAKEAGGDVAPIRSELSTSTGDLIQARQMAVKAAADTRLVPFSADRKAALTAANAEWKSARDMLRTARTEKVQGAKYLWALIKQLRLTHKVSASDFA